MNSHYNNQRLGIALVVLAIIVIAVAAPMSTSATIIAVACAVIGGFLIDG